LFVAIYQERIHYMETIATCHDKIHVGKQLEHYKQILLALLLVSKNFTFILIVPSNPKSCIPLHSMYLLSERNGAFGLGSDGPFLWHIDHSSE